MAESEIPATPLAEALARVGDRWTLLVVEALLVVPPPSSDRPPRAAYQLTAEGADLAGALRLLSDWAARHTDAPQAPRHAECGTPLQARWYCPTCDHIADHEPDADAVYV